MFRHLTRASLVGAALVLVLAACGGRAAPPASPACALGVVPSEAEFGRHFTAMALQDEAGSPGVADPAGGVAFEPADTVRVRAAAIEVTAVRICVAARDGGRPVVADIVAGFGPAEPTVELGLFEVGDYVAQVTVGDDAARILVRNLFFSIR